jgi:hypothetical protein
MQTPALAAQLEKYMIVYNTNYFLEQLGTIGKLSEDMDVYMFGTLLEKDIINLLDARFKITALDICNLCLKHAKTFAGERITKSQFAEALSLATKFLGMLIADRNILEIAIGYLNP